MTREGYRAAVRAILLGAAIGLPVLGVGSRISMRGIALANGTPAAFSAEGTLTVLLMGLGAGAIAGAIHHALSLVMPRRPLARDGTFVVVLAALTLRGLNPVDAQRVAWFAPPMLLFAALYLVACRRRTRVGHEPVAATR